jgi:integrase
MIVSRLLERAGIHKAQQGPHLLRHTAASMWLANGVELKQVQENLGHSNIGTTSRYLHLLEDSRNDFEVAPLGRSGQKQPTQTDDTIFMSTKDIKWATSNRGM